MRPHLATSLTAALAATFAVTGTASAADRFAEPGGNGPNPCLPADPCSLTLAAEFANDGDRVRVADGTYVLPGKLDMLDGNVTMEPAVPGTRPVIRHSANNEPTIVVAVGGLNPEPVTIRGFRVENTSAVTDTDLHPALRINSPAVVSDVVAQSRGLVIGMVVDDPGATVLEDSTVLHVAGTDAALRLSTGGAPQGTVTGRRLTVEAAAGARAIEAAGAGTTLLDSVARGGLLGVAMSEQTVVRRVSASGTAAGIAIGNGPNTLTDSVATANADNARALFVVGGPTQLRNVTAVAGGTGSYGIGVVGGATTARNVIARGDGVDLRVTAGSLTVDHSNFRTQQGIADGGANQSADPQFVDAAAGDFRLAPTSPAIDAGIADDVIGATDRTGVSRFQLAAPDLGAFEAAAKSAPNPAPPGGGAGGGGAADTTAPVLSGLRGKGKRRGTAKASFALDEAATVTVRLQKRKAGKRKGGACVKPTRKLRNAKSCKRYVTVATTTKPLAAGQASARIGKRLAAGDYRVTVSARDAAGNAARTAAKFRIAR